MIIDYAVEKARRTSRLDAYGQGELEDVIRFQSKKGDGEDAKVMIAAARLELAKRYPKAKSTGLCPGWDCPRNL